MGHLAWSIQHSGRNEKTGFKTWRKAEITSEKLPSDCHMNNVSCMSLNMHACTLVDTQNWSLELSMTSSASALPTAWLLKELWPGPLMSFHLLPRAFLPTHIPTFPVNVKERSQGSCVIIIVPPLAVNWWHLLPRWESHTI